MRVEFWVVIEVAIGMAGNVTECLQIFVCSLAVTEREQVERDLTMGQFNTRIFEESICRLEKVKALGTCLRRFARRLLQLWMSQNHLRNLEEDHLTANLLDNTICTL